MAVDNARLEKLLAYCHEDPLVTVDSQTLQTMRDLYEAAVGDLTEAGVSEPDEGTPRRAQYDLLVNAIVLDGLDNRGTQVKEQAFTDNPAFRRRLNQLKLTEPAES
ncbi:hypothetical protein SDC9_88884 [bioreactor metagenome]|uniref:Uncharacterized protein n=1 Tax=bioreactor metagenome TaxID=1076179 RepID=A0A644ZQQ7_9ZZZZ